MRRIRDNRENESLDNAIKAYDNYSRQKHSRSYVRDFDKDLLPRLQNIVEQIASETWQPKGYKEAVIFDRKRRKLAKAPIEDHVLESATILPYEKAIYDHSTWRAPAVKPGMGTHGLFKILRNEFYNWPQEEMMYYVTVDAHHYFPLMDHAILKKELASVVKDGKLQRFLFKVVDSYPQGAPLGIKVAQLFGQLYLARFDRLAMRFFDIGQSSEKLAYWTERYITARITTARTPEDFHDLCRGPAFLTRKFRMYVDEGVPFYLRFVDNIIIRHGDKAALHIILELAILHLARDWHVTVNEDYNVRPCWTGIRICGYVFYHERVAASKRNKQELARRVHKLMKKGVSEEEIRQRMSSRIGYVKHANSIHLFQKIGMEKSLGKIIKNRRVRSPFEGMSANQKVRFSTIVTGCDSEKKIKLMLLDYRIMDSKIDKDTILVQIETSQGAQQTVPQSKPNKALAIRFKRILRTSVVGGEEIYDYEKRRDEQGQPTMEDAEYYSFTGSKILIDQALNDFSTEDLPCPTVIQQYKAKNGQTFIKFT